jgi:hypothetical protein
VAEVALKKLMAKAIEENDDMPDIELAELLLDLVDEERGKKKRILVVGQIQYAGQEAAHTVALGPYSTAGRLDTLEQWQARSEAHTASRVEGGKLAWDTSTKTGRGRFMIVPLLKSARDAWDFFRGTPLEEIGEVLEEAQSIADWSIRGAPESPDVGPPCTCGLREASGHSSVLGVSVQRGCQRCRTEQVKPIDEWGLEF